MLPVGGVGGFCAKIWLQKEPRRTWYVPKYGKRPLWLTLTYKFVRTRVDGVSGVVSGLRAKIWLQKDRVTLGTRLSPVKSH